jgi:hypothetical protein
MLVEVVIVVPTRRSGLVVPPFAPNCLSYVLCYRPPTYPILSMVIMDPLGLLLWMENSISPNFKRQNISCGHLALHVKYLTCHARIIIALFVLTGDGPKHHLLVHGPLLLGAQICGRLPTRTLSHKIWIHPASAAAIVEGTKL